MQFSCCPWLGRFVGVGLIVAGASSLLLFNAYLMPRSAAQKGQATNDWPTFGGGPSRNMVNLSAKKTPTKWHVEGGKLKNIKFHVKLGTHTYGGPVVSGGRIFVGTNNGQPRDETVKGHKAVIMVFREKDGKYLYQIVHDMPPEHIVHDALRDGMCCTPTVEGDSLYYVTPSCEVICANTSDGKEKWTLDLMKKYKVFPNRLGICSPLLVGDTLYVVTGNGTSATTGKLVSPDAPSFIAINKKNGEVVWTSKLPGKNIIEGQWANAAYAKVDGVEQIICPGGDCRLYSLDAKTGKLLWQFHCNTTADVNRAKKRELTPNYIVSTPVVANNNVYVGVGIFPEHPAGDKVGHFWCVDIAKAMKHGKANKDHDVSFQADNLNPISAPNKSSALAWHYGGLKNPRPQFGRSVHFGRTISTAAVHGGLVYITEENGYLHCLDAKTGKKQWEFDFRTGIWGSPMWADGKVYVGTDDGDVFIFNQGRKKSEIGEPIYMDEPIQSTPVIANGTLYIMTKSTLYAVGGK